MATTKTTTKKATSSTASKASSTKKTATKASKPRKDETSEFQEFFVDELKDIYWAEKHFLKALPKMKKASTSKQLASAFENHVQETESHLACIEQVFSVLGEKPAAKKCDAMAGLLEEATGIIEDTDKGTMIRDAGLILAAQKMEHYLIATYGTLAVFAQNMGKTEAVKQLQMALEGGKKTDVALTKVSTSFVNEQAAAE